MSSLSAAPPLASARPPQPAWSCCSRTAWPPAARWPWAAPCLERRRGAVGAGQGYVADSLGSIAGGILFVCGHSLDHIALLVVPALVNLLAVQALDLPVPGRTGRTGPTGLTRRTRLAWLLGLALVAAVLFLDPDGLSTRLQYPQQRIVARANSPYGRLLLTRSEGQLNFIENGVPLTSTRDEQHIEETVHYALAQRPDARRVLLVSGAVSGTAREVLKYPVQRIDYVELDPLILELGKKYLPENLADPRLHIINTDGRLFIKQRPAASAEARAARDEGYDVIILDLPAPATAQLNRFYTVEFMAEVKRALAPGGVLSFSLGEYENYVSPELARLLASAHGTVKTSFRHTLLIPGGRVFFLASDGPLYPDIASRLEQRQVQTRLVHRHYLDAMLAPDRMADLERAVAQPAALNRDFSPILYFYHLRHWMSQFNTRFGPLQALLLAALGFYLVRLRRAALVLFASGFAGSALELVLLLAFQVLCGSVYHQVGLIVTVFMLGLACGAWWANRAAWAWQQAPVVESGVGAPRGQGPKVKGRPVCSGEEAQRVPQLLAWLSAAIAAYSLCLPLILPALGRLGGTASAVLAIKTVIAALTFLLAALAGVQFPLAIRLDPASAPSSLSRLYTADFLGACLGALLSSTLLIPLLGLSGACLLTAALNALAAVVVGRVGLVR